jgi:hypothetical protein
MRLVTTVLSEPEDCEQAEQSDDQDPDKDGSEQHFDNGEIGEEELADDHFVPDHPAFLEEETEDNTGDESKNNLKPAV